MNNIELSTVYLPLFDEAYKQECKTSILEGDEFTVKKGSNGELKIAKLDMDGLGDFSRNSGYTQGSTSFVWEVVKYDKERSQDLRIDRLDNDENISKPFAKLSGEFMRTKVAPETDAARIAKLADTAGITRVSEALSTGAQVVASLRTCANTMDEDEVPAESRILFITPTLKGLVDDLDTTKSRKVLDKFPTIIEVPGSRMLDYVDLNDGTTAYGYKKGAAKYKKTEDVAIDSSKTYYTKSGDTYSAVASPDVADIGSYYEMTHAAGHNVNFLCVERSAVVCALDQYIKYFTPDEDQNGDSHVFKYRNNNLYGHVYENKLAGVYASVSTS